jgi:hypothetical protein
MQVRPEFARFGVADPGRLGAYLERRSFAQGDCLMRQGTAGGECYFIEEGEVRLEVGEGRWSRTKTAARNRSSSGRAPLRLQGDHPAVGADGGQVLSHCLANRDRSDGGCAPSAPVAGRPAPAAGRPATSNDASNARSGSAGGATVARLAIRFFVGCPLVILMIIQTILLHPSGAVWTDGAPNVSRLDPSGAVQSNAEHPARNRKVAVESAPPLRGTNATLAAGRSALPCPGGGWYDPGRPATGGQ